MNSPESRRLFAVIVASGAVGILVGRVFLTPEPEVRRERVVEEVQVPVTPRACQQAIRDAQEFAEGAVKFRIDEEEDLLEVLRAAYDLGLRGDEEEFVGGLLRYHHENLQFTRTVWADNISQHDYLGWASSGVFGEENSALECLGLEEQS